jgi:hypothetical protein
MEKKRSMSESTRDAITLSRQKNLFILNGECLLDHIQVRDLNFYFAAAAPSFEECGLTDGWVLHQGELWVYV